MAATWLFTVYAYWRAQRDRRWWLYTGVAFGLALATKHNALFLPFVIGLFGLAGGFLATRDNLPARTTFYRLVGAFAATKPQRVVIVTRSRGDYGTRTLFDTSIPVLPGLERPPTFVF